ncbi:MAG: TIGR03619 family F420-dependent LLM class oxidoreductase [Actinomycetota bacterium]
MSPTLSLQLISFSGADEPDWGTLIEQATGADEAGVDRLIVSDHIAFGNAMEAYADPKLGGTRDGKQPTGPDGHWLEPLTLLSVIAGRTSHVRLQTGILLAALRRPAVLAKTAATLDVLSGGRLDLGVGVGWQREEYDVAGLDFQRRGRQLDHTLEVCRALWTETAASYESDDLAFADIHAMPKPAQPGGVPIWVSGRINAPVLRRIARFGAGWIPWGDDALDPLPGIARIRDALASAGRDDRVDVQGSLPAVRTGDGELDLDATMAAVPPLAAAGITDFKAFVRLGGGHDQTVEELTPLVEAFRGAVGRT